MLCTGPLETFIGNNDLHGTTTDHIIIHKENLHLIENCIVADDHCNNLSHHLPIFCTLSRRPEPTECYTNPTAHLAWNKINDEKVLKTYRRKVKGYLEEYHR